MIQALAYGIYALDEPAYADRIKAFRRQAGAGDGQGCPSCCATALAAILASADLAPTTLPPARCDPLDPAYRLSPAERSLPPAAWTQERQDGGCAEALDDAAQRGT